jgi:5-(carboxyamino)imidazole ribonucleotide mutase/phosphoribosylaminoimidazole-succinocarboxamide synthase
LKPLVIILMGSKADMEHCQKIAAACQQFGLETVLRIGSAHKTAGHALAILRQYEAETRPKVFITVAGRSNALSGFTDGAVSAPVIACPPASESYGGADVYSSLRMPAGVAPGLVLEPVNAALLAAKFFGQYDQEIHQAVVVFQLKQAEKIIEDDSQLYL